MSGADIPYQLRPSKFIDRQIFVELLSRLIQVRGPENYIYISMGGRHLVDHYAVYRELGIKAQFSFDSNENAVARQIFNRPTDATICGTMHSSALPSELDAIAAKFPTRRNVIVWLDYTNTDRKLQLQEAEQTLIRLKHGDLFRITMNANVRHLKQGPAGGSANKETFRANDLRDQIEDMMPTTITEIGDNDFPLVLLKCIELTTLRAKAHVPHLDFLPVLTTSYADGQRMLTVSCAVSDSSQHESFPNSQFYRWQFASSNWEHIHDISVPVLSAKERYKLDSNLKKSPKRMLKSLKFMPADDEPSSLAAVSNYKKFQRFYPAFRHVDD
jgi:putative O-methyltransferase